MKARISALLLTLAVCCVQARTQTAHKTNPHKEQSKSVQHNSGPLTWITSDVDPKTVFWIQGRFVPVGNASFHGDPAVATILCSVRESECLEIDATNPFAHSEQAWIEEYKAVSWDKSGILGTTRSLDGCTDETLRIRFSPPSVVIINSPVMPIPQNCRKANGAMDKLMGKKGWAITAQTEEDQLVPTRGLFSFQDGFIDTGGTPPAVAQKKP